MDYPDEQNSQTGKIEEDDIHAEDIERRAFLRIGVFAATGLVGLTMACGDSSDAVDQDGDTADADPTDPADADGDPVDAD